MVEGIHEKTHLRCKEPVGNTGEGEFRLRINLISSIRDGGFIVWCWWDSYVTTTSCQVIHHADLWWFKFNLIEEFPAPQAFLSMAHVAPGWMFLLLKGIIGGTWVEHLTHTKRSPGHQVMVNLYQPSCEYPYPFLLLICFCSCRDFSTAQHFHWSYSNIPKNIRQQTCHKKSPLWITWIRAVATFSVHQLKTTPKNRPSSSPKRNGTNSPMFFQVPWFWEVFSPLFVGVKSDTGKGASPAPVGPVVTSPPEMLGFGSLSWGEISEGGPTNMGGFFLERIFSGGLILVLHHYDDLWWRVFGTLQTQGFWIFWG